MEYKENEFGEFDVQTGRGEVTIHVRDWVGDNDRWEDRYYYVLGGVREDFKTLDAAIARLTQSMVVEQVKPIQYKFSGADWLSKNIKGASLSPFGVVVANVLGQVHKGIYHIDRDVLRDCSIWSDDSQITLSSYGGLHTFDDCDLTFLLLCCVEAGVEVEISALPRRGYIRYSFTVAAPKKLAPELRVKIPSFDACVKFVGNLDPSTSKSKRLLRLSDVTGDRFADVIHDRAVVTFSELYLAVAAAHESCTRIGLKGNGGNRLLWSFSARKREGAFSERHPSLDEAVKALKSYASIDYSAL